MSLRIAVILMVASVSPAQNGNIRPDLTSPQTETRMVRDPRQHLLFQFSEARGEFATVIEQFRASFWSEKDRKKAAKAMEQKVDVFLKYLRVASTERPTFDPGDLKNLTSAQLSTEVLTLAQRLRPELRRVARTENNSIVPVSYWEFLYKLEADLLRLKWMTSQLR